MLQQYLKSLNPLNYHWCLHFFSHRVPLILLSQYFLGCPFHFVCLPPFQLRPCNSCLDYCIGCINRAFYAPRPRHTNELSKDSSLVILLPVQKSPVVLLCVINKIWMPYLSFYHVPISVALHSFHTRTLCSCKCDLASLVFSCFCGLLNYWPFWDYLFLLPLYLLFLQYLIQKSALLWCRLHWL